MNANFFILLLVHNLPALPDLHHDIEQHLLRRTADGDAGAFSEIYERYSGAIFTAIMRYVRSKAEAEEILQQVFVGFWERRASLSAVRSLKDYFFISTRNAVFHHFSQIAREGRMTRHLQENAPEPSTDNTDRRLREKEYDRLLEDTIGQLPPQQRHVYILAQHQELSYEEIATQLGLSRLTVKKHLELARKFVRRRLAAHFSDYASLLAVFFI
ncbi:RNA polymerase sigma-70 factor [Chitinophaga lutea]